MQAKRRRTARRPTVVLLIISAVVLVFFGRLFEVQVVRADTLNAQSKDRRSVSTTLTGDRGAIVDASGTVLATTVARYTVTASPRLAVASGTATADARRIAGALHVPAPGIVAALTRAPKSDYTILAKSVPLATLQRVKALGIAWLYYDEVGLRVYPDGAVAGNLVGFVGSDGTPQAGIEYADNRCLAGHDGETTSEGALDGTAIPGTRVVTKPARQGGTVRLTIDSDLQWYAQQVLTARAAEVGAKWGSVVVEEVATGRLLAVADTGTVDPNDVNATASHDTGALGSRAFSAPFEPGSTMKSITAASLLDAGLATPASRVTAPYRYRTAAGADVNDSEFHATERLTLTGVLVESSNTGISQLGSKMPAEDRYRYLKRFGFGTRTEVGFGAEAGGDLGANAPHWDAQSTLATMFGQGLTSTSVQMASAYQAIANGGVRMPVRLVEGCSTASGHTGTPVGAPRRVVSAAAAKQTVRMLENVATKGWLRADVRIPGYRVGIKTGTAQESDGSGRYAKGYLVSMAGVAPAQHPRFVVYVDLNDPVKMNTSQATAPVFRQVMARALQRSSVVPSGSASPDLPTTW